MLPIPALLAILLSPLQPQVHVYTAEAGRPVIEVHLPHSLYRYASEVVVADGDDNPLWAGDLVCHHGARLGVTCYRAGGTSTPDWPVGTPLKLLVKLKNGAGPVWYGVRRLMVESR
jgi:hypothetical protein